MHLKNAVARLERAGAERSRTMEKLREAVHILGVFLTQVFQEDCGRGAVNLPRGYTFEHWPSSPPYFHLKKTAAGKQCLFLGEEDGGRRRVMFRRDLLQFAEDIATGWLDELSQLLEAEANIFAETAEHVGSFPNVRQ